ncbi:MAG: GNAT family N-acetyltransferase [Oscillospiraceae bacterium]|nr:GNAT family N-acetyltransferase [Oscillospiraceae bacterium]
MKIVKLSELNEAQLDQALTVFVEGLYRYMGASITKDKSKLHILFKHMLDPAQVVVALQEDRAVGICGWGKRGSRAAKACRKLLVQQLGLYGYGVYLGLNVSQPNLKGDDEAAIEYLAVCESMRGQGVGGKLINHLCDTLPYRSYTLETTEENASAVRLYSKLGFVRSKNHSLLVRVAARVFGVGTPIFMHLELPCITH